VAKIDTLNVLKDLGMTTYEAKIYLTLLKNNRLDARQLSFLADIPMSKIYSILKKLEREDIIKITLEKPRIYTAVNPEKAFTIIRDKEIRNWDAKQRLFLEIIKPIKKKDLIEKGEIEIIHDVNLTINKIIQIIKNSRLQVKASIPNISAEVDQYMRLIGETFKRTEIAFQLMVDERIYDQLPSGENIQTKIRKNNKMGVVIGDNQEVVLVWTSPWADGQSIKIDSDKRKKNIQDFPLWENKIIEKNHEKILADQTKSWVDQGKITSLWTNNLTLVQMSKLLFDEAWSESYKVVQ